MYRVVLDANVLISAFSGFRRNRYSVTVRIPNTLLESDLALVFISDHVADEVGRALSRPYFRDRMTGTERMWAFDAIHHPPFQWIEPVEVVGIASHSEDDIVIDTALAGNAEYLVASDRQLLKLETHDGITIVSPPEFLAILESTD